ncbi:hypothetical protein [Candidatus Protochlamydia phocaeensis]|uniref:hypothetical protein n=1 Tax=Candidatus Protochlamydia phocaeensis TaxID=1414722 RepID=UPI00083885E0|nr:hypothetical protein [Candidatus Protochlamydia phocaeensis]
MTYFPNTYYNLSLIVEKPVLSIDGYSHEAGSLKGRGICLFHTLATPLKALSGVGRLILATASIATRTFAVLTLNAHPRELIRAAAVVIDVPVGTVLLCVSLATNIIRGVLGTIFHPGIMIEDARPFTSCADFHYFAAEHNLLAGTFVNY